MKSIDTIIFDLGGVLIDWNPRYLYRKIFKTEKEIDWFIENICTGEWNDEQDAGRPFEEATKLLIEKYPEWEAPILAYHQRWEEMLGGPILETVEILQLIKENPHYRLYALTNWSAETFPIAKKNFNFLGWFEGVLVSGEEKTRKPYADIYQKLFQRFNIDPTSALFIDDNTKNIEGGKNAGLQVIHFTSAQKLKEEMLTLGILSSP